MQSEKILSPQQRRYTLLPIQHPELFRMDKEARAQFWVADEIDLSGDKFDDLSETEQSFLKNVLGFFAGSDGIVNQNIDTNFLSEVEVLEIRRFYNFQTAIEDEHSEFYSNLIDTYIKNPTEKQQLFDALEEIPAVKMKMKWALDWMNKDCTFVEKLVAFALVESLFFQSQFASVFYFRERNTLTGLCQGNEQIMKDETSHYNFATHIYNNHIENKLSDEKLKEMVISCLETELRFVDDIMPDGLLGLSKDMMKTYCKYIADTILVNFGSTPIYNVNQPLAYMEKLAIPRKTNFFEKRVADYTRADNAIMDITLDDF